MQKTIDRYNILVKGWQTNSPEVEQYMQVGFYLGLIFLYHFIRENITALLNKSFRKSKKFHFINHVNQTNEETNTVGFASACFCFVF